MADPMDRAVNFVRADEGLDDWLSLNPTCECGACASRLKRILWAALDCPGEMPEVAPYGLHLGRRMVDLSKLSGERLRAEARRADRALAAEIARLRGHDPEFRAVIDHALAVEDEQLRRRKGGLDG